MKGGHGDNYYYQMVANIRSFKGMPEKPRYSPAQKVTIDGEFGEWEAVLPDFRSHKGNTLERDSPGWGDLHYENKTGRNDIIRTKVTHDANNLYFYVETAAPLTSPQDPAWMRLFIDTGRNKATGWEGYDFVVNRTSPGKTSIIEKSSGNWQWEKAGEVEYAFSGNQLEIKVPLKSLGIEGKPNIEFKWSDNMQEDGNIMDFLLHGDVAPAGRFNYFYQP